jgi:transcriptional regulator with XRE-family HTH domain
MTRVERRKFGERLRGIRTDRKLSMKQLAGKVGMSVTALGRHERGRAVPGLDVAAALAKALDVSIDYLAIGEDPRRSSPASSLLERILQAIDGLPRELRESLAALFLGESGTSGNGDLQNLIPPAPKPGPGR